MSPCIGLHVSQYRLCRNVGGVRTLVRVLPQVDHLVDDVCADISPPLRSALVSNWFACLRLLPYSIIFLGSPPLSRSQYFSGAMFCELGLPLGDEVVDVQHGVLSP